MRHPTNIYLATLWLVSIKSRMVGTTNSIKNPTTARYHGGGYGAWSSGLPRAWWLPGTAAQEGNSVELVCQVAAGEFDPAIWLKLDPQDPNNHMLLSHGDLVITEDPRFSVRYHDDDNVYVLKIQGVSSGDAGSYQCQVPVSSEEEELKVEAAPPVVVTLLTTSSASLPACCPFFLLLFLLLLGVAR